MNIVYIKFEGILRLIYFKSRTAWTIIRPREFYIYRESICLRKGITCETEAAQCITFEYTPQVL